MPLMNQDKKSGGIIFSLTPEEKSIVEMENNLKKMTSEVEEKLKALDKAIANANKKK